MYCIKSDVITLETIVIQLVMFDEYGCMGPKWPFLLMYVSHDMRHTGFHGLTGCQRDPREMGRHRTSLSRISFSAGAKRWR